MTMTHHHNWTSVRTIIYKRHSNSKTRGQSSQVIENLYFSQILERTDESRDESPKSAILRQTTIPELYTILECVTIRRREN